MRQHIDSFNHFVEVDLAKILKANDMIKSDVRLSLHACTSFLCWGASK